MKKKKINKNENEWKGILQETQSNISTESVTSTNVNIENVKEFQNQPFYLENSNSSDYDVEDLTKKWKEFAKDKTLNGEEEHCNVGVNKDWETTKEELNKFYHENWVKENVNYKQERIDFEFTPFTFWQLIPSVAINLHCNEIELTWLCFGMYIRFK